MPNKSYCPLNLDNCNKYRLIKLQIQCSQDYVQSFPHVSAVDFYCMEIDDSYFWCFFLFASWFLFLGLSREGIIERGGMKICALQSRNSFFLLPFLGGFHVRG